jgi:hypothetical protein
MNELRPWSEEEATADELRLLDVSRRERAPGSARARALGALGVLAATTTTGATAAAGGSTLLAKVLAATVLTGAVTAGGVAWHASRRHPEARPLPASTEVAMPREATGPPSVPTTSPAPAPAPSAEPPRELARAARPISSGALAQEVAALELARQALLARDGDSAIRALDRYRAQFPRGELSSEATVLRVQALLARGDVAKAAALADDYCTAYPESPYAQRVQQLVHDVRKK